MAAPPIPQGAITDRSTQTWVRATGRQIDLVEHPWLDGPFGLPDRIGDEWLSREADRLGGTVAGEEADAGLLATMDDLKGPEFDPSSLRPEIREFYEHTSRWRLEVWSQWCPVAWPFGWLISSLFAQRLEQLSLPMRPLDVAHGMDSRVVPVVDRRGRQLGVGWIRTARATGQTTYSGWYGITRLPGSTQPSVRVVFPLPNGSVTVFLRPETSIDGALRLVSPIGEFGEDGAYLIVREDDGTTASVRRVPLVERFEVYVDSDGILRTDHDLRLWSVGVIRLHYRIDRRPGSV